MKYLEHDGNIHLCCYYANHEGNVFYFYGSGPNGVMGRDANDKHIVVSSKSLLQDFRRLAVMDFPQAKDPRLVYEFDLNFDLKRVSDIAYLGMEYWDLLNHLLQQHYHCELQGTEPEDLAQLSAVVRQHNDLINGYLQPESVPPKPSFDHWVPFSPS